MSVTLRIVNPNGFAGAEGKSWDLLDGPSPGIQANGIGGDWKQNHHIEIVEDGRMPKETPGKPPYRIPLVK